MNRNLTIVLPSYRSSNLVLRHVKKLSHKYKIIIIENSFDKNLASIVKQNYKNVDIYLRKNIGFGRAINYASKKIKSKYFFVINPDTNIYSYTIKNLLSACKKIKKFGSISPIHIEKKRKYKNKLFVEEKLINGQAMLFETKTFKKIKGFDKNYFLYYEENDFFKRCNMLNYKLYLITNSFYNHTKIDKKNNNNLQLHSTTFSNIEEKKSTYFVGGWHGQWSKFYYYKKYYGMYKALFKCLPNIFLNILQLSIYILLNPKKVKYKYYKVEGFVCSLLGLPSFKRSKFDKKYIY